MTHLPFDVVLRILSLVYWSESHHPVEDISDISQSYTDLSRLSLVNKEWNDASQLLLWKVVCLESAESVVRCLESRRGMGKDVWLRPRTTDLVLVGRRWKDSLLEIVDLVGRLRGIERLWCDGWVELPLMLFLCFPNLKHLDLGVVYIDSARLREFRNLCLSLRHLSIEVRVDTGSRPMDFRIIHYHLFSQVTSLYLRIHKVFASYSGIGDTIFDMEYVPVFAAMGPHLRSLHLHASDAMWDRLSPFFVTLFNVEKLVIPMKSMLLGLLGSLPCRPIELHLLDVRQKNLEGLKDWVEHETDSSERLKLLVVYGELDFARRSPNVDGWMELELLKACARRGIAFKLVRDWRSQSMLQ